MSTAPPGILQPLPVVARCVLFRPAEGAGDHEGLAESLKRLAAVANGEDSPTWAHVKRTAQESFEPPAFMVRRSMPCLMSTQAGLMFVAFGKSHDAFDVQMRRMAGYEDGILDAMFRISKPATGSYFWCPPVRDGKLDLRQLGL